MARMLLCCCCCALLIQSGLGADANAAFLSNINEYRLSQGLPAFGTNAGASCVARQVAEKFRGTSCTNSTGTDTVDGQEPQFDDALLKKCNLQLVNVKDGFIGPSCVPAGISAADAPKVAAINITKSQYAELNDTKYVSAGAGSVDNAWFVMVLATNASEGNFINQDLDPSSAFALRVSLAPIAVIIYVVSTMALGCAF